MDETTCHLWQTPSRMWLKPGMTFTIPSTRGPSMQVLGALSEKRGLIHFDVFIGSNNQDTFKLFIEGLRRKCAGCPTLVVMDNLSVHKAKIVVDLFIGSFKYKLLPPYSCALNPIERVWNILKGQWKAHIH